jgi:DNA transposition AAA+ family ATPase
MYPYQSPPAPRSASSDTATSDQAFVETVEYHRFVEFCDACREFRYIGLCYGAPGIGKTLSALRYSRAEMILKSLREPAESRDQLPIDTVLYTTEVVNTPARVQSDIRCTRERLKEVALRPIHQEATYTLDAIRVRDEARRAEIMNKPGCSPCDRPAVDPTYFQTFERFQALKRAVPDPTTLILVDEADRLHMNSLETIRSIFDDGGIGMVLIGMPGIEKRVARFPQFYSRIGFVHEFRPLDEAQMTTLLNERWLPAGVRLPDALLAPEVIATLIRMSGGNFRLLTRLLTQVERILKVNQSEIVSKEIVTAARDSLVIGQG